MYRQHHVLIFHLHSALLLLPAKFFKEAELLLPETDKKTAIISMDIDGFKYFNDMFGYGEGNDLLRYIWQKNDRQ